MARLLGTQEVMPVALQVQPPCRTWLPCRALFIVEYPLWAEVGARGSVVTLGRGLAGLEITRPRALNLTILKNEMASWISRSCSELWRALLLEALRQ